MAGVADPVHHTKLGYRIRECPFDVICKTFEIIGAGDQDIFQARAFKSLQKEADSDSTIHMPNTSFNHRFSGQ